MNSGSVTLQPILSKNIIFSGTIGTLLKKVQENWLLQIREADPAIIDMLRVPNQRPYRFLLPWSGEFAGKYLTGAIQIYSMTQDQALGKYITEFVQAILQCQQANGYIGPFAEDYQLSGRAPAGDYMFNTTGEQNLVTWDAWGHYHIMMALMLWWEESGDENSLLAACRIGDLFCSKFYGEGKPPLSSIGSCEMNLSVLHSFALLYQKTQKPTYLQFAQQIVEDFSKDGCGDFYRQALAGVDFYKMPLPRWEGLHAIEGLELLYEITGNEDYRRAFEHLWWSMTRTDLHNTGGFTTEEQAIGTPFKDGKIETCCTIAYMAVTVDMLRLTGNSICADVLEWCTLNSGIAAFSPSGRWSTYDTPMRGYKRSSHDSIVFQCRPGSPDLNCCSVNAPRVFGFLTDWAYMSENGILTVQYYGSHTAELICNDNHIKICQETQYPKDGRVVLHISGLGGKFQTIKLRIPYWSKKTNISVGDRETQMISHSGYYTISRVWEETATVVLDLDVSFRYQAGEDEMDGLSSIFYGPLLLCLDPWHNPDVDFMNLPALDADNCIAKFIRVDSRAGLLIGVDAADGTPLTLCDLYTAGMSGTPYTSWLSIKHVVPTAFSSANPGRTS